ncbi:hypothetical protein PRECH8_07410 [Insulibacter thermoxylanivorax]|uniref:Uncharacterized protein n=1 Tax=Insulibacter thermoxylanivorax TaxID=2749268 RepID=A0A916VGE9_9BACL|nr:hypothetical protein [Insulibacter thermoxylanivorax]GFR37445.1 hypothetical protein PRECH8_07410 [Insulibacter thermoxylanivorax]
MDAIAQQAQASSYNIDGKLRLRLDAMPFDVSDQPYTAVILGQLQQGEIAWSGVTDLDAVRSEATLQFTSADASSSFIMPILLDNEQLYIQVPVINMEGEYFVLPAPEAAKHLAKPLLASFAHLIEAMDSKWFQNVTIEGTDYRVKLTIDDQNWEAFLAAVSKAMPDILAEWQSIGILTSTQATAVAGRWASFAETKGGNLRPADDRGFTLEATIDEAGYIAMLTADITLVSKDGGTPTDSRYDANLRVIWTQINEPATFVRPIPEDTVPIEEILKLIP